MGDLVGTAWGFVFWTFMIWVHFSTKPFLPALVSLVIILICMATVGFVASKIAPSFTLEAYDDSDAIVLKRGRHSERIPFHQICQVDYVRADGGTQKVRLHLTQPSRFGNPVTFVIARDSTPDRHSAIADDLHRRAREAREMLESR